MRISDWSSDVCSSDLSCHACVLRPESRGSVTLASADPAAAPLIDPGFLTDDRDMATLRAGVRMMHRIVATPTLADYGGVDRPPVQIGRASCREGCVGRCCCRGSPDH